jgi:hypothetical protein
MRAAPQLSLACQARTRCQMIMACRARELQVFAVPGTEMPSTAIAEHDDPQDREMRWLLLLQILVK